jgi:hypothetical protein
MVTVAAEVVVAADMAEEGEEVSAAGTRADVVARREADSLGDRAAAVVVAPEVADSAGLVQGAEVTDRVRRVITP